jgi:hypothetical protein
LFVLLDTGDDVLDDEEEGINYKEENPFQMDADEMDCSDEEGDEEEEEGIDEPEGNEEQRRLREINANDTDSDSDSVESELNVPTARRVATILHPHRWSWPLPPEERAQTVSGFLRLMSDVLCALRQILTST